MKFMKMMRLLLLLGIVVLGQCQDDLSCVMEENPVTACTASQILQYIRMSGINEGMQTFFDLSYLTDAGSSCDGLMELLQGVRTRLNSGECMPASVTSDDEPEGRSGAAETGDPEDDAITEVIDEPHNSPGEEPVVRDDPGTEPTSAPNPSECYTNADGSDYFGDVSVTVNGLTCQSWAERTPHRPIRKYRGYNDPMHPNHFGAHNHCRTLPYMAVRRGEDRNNYSGREGPWCHTTDPEVRWEYCDVGEPRDSCP